MSELQNNNNKKRLGGVGDIWHGLLGDDYASFITPAIDSCLKGNSTSFKEYGKYTVFIDHSDTIRVQAVTEKDNDGKLRFISIFPSLPLEFENCDFEVESIDEWENEAEAVIKGSLFGMFSFFCQNYVEYKSKDLIGKKIMINLSVIGKFGGMLPEQERTFVPDKGPAKGEKFYMDKMKYLNPDMGGEPEFCDFFFPIQDIQKIKFKGKDILKIKGITVGPEEKDCYYNLYINPELVKNPELLKVGEPFHGHGWCQAEIAGIYK